MKKHYWFSVTLCFLLFFRALSAQVPPYVPANGLKTWWGFTGNYNDYSGNANHGTPIGAVSLTTDRFANPNSAIIIADSGRIQLTDCPTTGTGDFTISAWFLTGPYTKTTRKIILNFGTGTTNNAVLTYIQDSLVHLDLIDHFGPVSGVAVTDSVWHMVTFRNTGGVVQIFIDGLPSGAPVSMSPNIICLNKNIGGNPTMSSFFYGKLDDIGVWDRVLTQQEITNLYTGSCDTSYSTVVISACNSYTWPQNNQTYTQSGVYKDTLLNYLGCDSIVTLDLTIVNLMITQQPTTVQTNTGSTAQFTVAASLPGATYRWQANFGTGPMYDLMDTGQYSGTQTPTLTVSNINVYNQFQYFKCIVNIGICADTSDFAHIIVSDIGIEETNGAPLFHVFPNPASDYLYLKAAARLFGTVFTVADQSGRVVVSDTIDYELTRITIGELPAGIYILTVGDRMKQAFRVVKR
jgi:hypothetical protein